MLQHSGEERCPAEGRRQEPWLRQAANGKTAVFQDIHACLSPHPAGPGRGRELRCCPGRRCPTCHRSAGQDHGESEEGNTMRWRVLRGRLVKGSWWENLLEAQGERRSWPFLSFPSASKDTETLREPRSESEGSGPGQGRMPGGARTAQDRTAPDDVRASHSKSRRFPGGETRGVGSGPEQWLHSLGLSESRDLQITQRSFEGSSAQ